MEAKLNYSELNNYSTNKYVLDKREKLYLKNMFERKGILERVATIEKIIEEDKYYIKTISGSVLDIPYFENRKDLFLIPKQKEKKFDRMQLNRQYTVNELFDLYGT